MPQLRVTAANPASAQAHASEFPALVRHRPGLPDWPLLTQWVPTLIALLRPQSAEPVDVVDRVPVPLRSALDDFRWLLVHEDFPLAPNAVVRRGHLVGTDSDTRAGSVSDEPDVC